MGCYCSLSSDTPTLYHMMKDLWIWLIQTHVIYVVEQYSTPGHHEFSICVTRSFILFDDRHVLPSLNVSLALASASSSRFVVSDTLETSAPTFLISSYWLPSLRSALPLPFSSAQHKEIDALISWWSPLHPFGKIFSKADHCIPFTQILLPTLTVILPS